MGSVSLEASDHLRWPAPYKLSPTPLLEIPRLDSFLFGPLLEFETPGFFFITPRLFLLSSPSFGEFPAFRECALPYWKIPRVRIVVSECLKLTVCGSQCESAKGV